jgi:uncharacterized protein (TIGR02646 family)
MRPVSKGAVPYKYIDGQPYGKAVEGLAARIGRYCSYCERCLNNGIEVEHIQPKSVHVLLETLWSNFLLSCKNCNSTKSKKDPTPADWLIPDRDNTAAAFTYRKDGVIDVNAALVPPQSILATNTLDLMKLNRKIRTLHDEKGVLVALDRRNQRLEAWALAERWAIKYTANPTVDIEDAITDIAIASGFFSIWMTAFQAIPQMRRKLIQGFSGTEVVCFDPLTTLPLLPHPNLDGWISGGKI